MGTEKSGQGKCSMFTVQLPYVIEGARFAQSFTKDAAPEAPPKTTIEQ
jgi:hypothetical protein